MAGQDDIVTCVCPLGGIIELISRKWALLVINTIGNNGTLRFNQIMKNLDGINPKTLSSRLREIEEFGLVERRSYAEIPPRVEYTLTDEGMELRKAIVPLMEWTYKHDEDAERGTTPCDVAADRS
jgi:DNA-binding HxlR family transcriptional regulator